MCTEAALRGGRRYKRDSVERKYAGVRMKSWSGILHSLCGWPSAVDGKIILKWTAEKFYVKCVAALNWVWTSGADVCMDVWFSQRKVVTWPESNCTRLKKITRTLAQEWVELWAFMKTVMNLQIPVALRNFVTGRWRRGVCFIAVVVRIAAYWFPCVSKFAFVA
jgi:hypothetical protein